MSEADDLPRADQAEGAADELGAGGEIHFASVEVLLGFVVTVCVHEDEHHGTLGHGHTAELSRGMGEQQSGLENALDIDVVETGGLRLEKFDAGFSSYRHQVRADITTQVDNHLDALELRRGRLVAVEDLQLVAGAYGLDDIGTPGRSQLGNRMGKEKDIEFAHGEVLR